MTNAVVVVSNAEEESAARQILGSSARVVAWDTRPSGAEFENKEVLIWLNKEPAYRDVVNIASKIILRKAKRVLEIDAYDEVMGKSPTEALSEGMDAKTFGEWSSALSRKCAAGDFRFAENKPAREDFLNDPLPNENQVQMWSDLGLALTKNHQPIPNADNVLRILQKVGRLAGVIWLDDFTGSTMITFDGETRQWTDDDTRMLWIDLQRKMGMGTLGKESVYEAVMACGRINRKHPVKDWLGSVVWDKKPRLDNFFRDYMGAEDTEFNRAVSRNFFISMIARIYKPGCKVDHMIILEGKQGARKSSALRAIAGEWFTECNEPLGGNNKDFYGILHGKMLVEIAELDSFSKAETTKIKAIISTPTDRYRQPYGRITLEHPRTFIFVGTTNIGHYLGDATGGRRFLPMAVNEIKLEAIVRDRSQLFAEAKIEWEAGKSWWEVPEEAAIALQESRRKADAWEEALGEFLLCKDFTTSSAIAKEVLDLPIDKRDDRMNKRIANCMRSLGWTQRVERSGTKTHRVWRKA